MNKNRRPFSGAVETEVLLKCRRRCVLCYWLKGDLEWKRGQLAHIDRDHSNVSLENAAYLCTTHHDEYDTRPSQTKRLTPAEIRAAQESIYKKLESPEWWTVVPHKIQKYRGRGISLDVYDRRLPIYRTTIQFFRDVVSTLNPEMKLILQFNRDTDEALFLFDETVNAYLDELFKRALRLNTVELLLERSRRDGDADFAGLLDERQALALWLTSQYEIIRGHFLPFLRLSR